ncbi:MAG: hypothetical protein E7018_06615 [Alphaproteobacteria bacterium]|nr:hypothetical protein [Alphaproteobacteria bacterium]
MAEQNQAKKEPQKDHEPGCEKLGFACGFVGAALGLVNYDRPGMENPYAAISVGLLAAAVLLQKDKNGHTYLYNLMGAVEENAPRIAAKILRQSPNIAKAFGCAIRSAIQVTANQTRKAKVRAEINRQNKKYLSPSYEAPLYLNENGKRYKIENPERGIYTRQFVGKEK